MFKLQTSNFKLQISNFKLQGNHKLQTSNSKLQTSMFNHGANIPLLCDPTKNGAHFLSVSNRKKSLGMIYNKKFKICIHRIHQQLKSWLTNGCKFYHGVCSVCRTCNSCKKQLKIRFYGTKEFHTPTIRKNLSKSCSHGLGHLSHCLGHLSQAVGTFWKCRFESLKA